MLLPIHSEFPEPRKISRVVEALKDGEVIAYPTDTVYGLGCDLMNKKAVDKLLSIKRMPASHPLTFVCPDLSDIARYAVVENLHYRFLKRIFPGPYCVILQSTREVPKLVQSKKKTVGIRVPNHAIAIAITKGLGTPLISTTARRQGAELPEIDPSELDEAFPGLAIVVDGGAGNTTPSTVIDLTSSPFKVVREGLGAVENLA